MMLTRDLESKQNEFNSAMNRYNTNSNYKNIYKLVSFFNVTLQVLLLYVLTTFDVTFIWFLPLFFLAYFLTDFINGLVHLYMDNNESYSSLVGPFIASFHLHHKTPKYTNNNLLLIYFNESGTKFWLVFYLFLVLFLSYVEVNEMILSVLIFIGTLSSVAEVSHYLCHNSSSKFVLFFQNIGLLLSMKHHQVHHNSDNVSYAFLNGMSDVFIDKIAKRFYGGYKEKSDKHYKEYSGYDTANRG